MQAITVKAKNQLRKKRGEIYALQVVWSLQISGIAIYL